MKLLFVLIIVSVNTLEPPIENSYIGNCYLADKENSTDSSANSEHLTFECTSTYEDEHNNYFAKDKDIECASEFTSKSVSKDRIVEMNFKNCSISTLFNSIFELYTNLSILDASGLGLETLQNELFRQAYQLTQLNVSNNRLTEVQPFRFTNAKKLGAVDLSFNKIIRIDPHAFVGNLTSLKNLTFSHNNITHLQRELFDHLQYLECLNLSYNAINELEEQMFNNLTNLKYLDLSHNPIKKLNKHLFTSSVQLKHLYLVHTELKMIESKTFARLEHLELLDLSDNNLKVLDIRAFDNGIFLPKFDSLQILLIARNQLHELNGFSSSRLPFVKIVGIEHNKFDCCYLERLLRQMNRKQLELPFDENTFHPKMFGAQGEKCVFGNDFVYADNGRNGVFEWIEVLIIICMLLLALLFGMLITNFKQKKRTYERNDPIEIQCEARTRDTNEFRRPENSNVYEVPRY